MPRHVCCFKVGLADGGTAQRDPDGAAVLALAALEAEVESRVRLAFDNGQAPEKGMMQCYSCANYWEIRLVADGCC